MRFLAIDYFQAVEDLAMRRPFPDIKNHRFSEPPLRAKLGQGADAGMDFHSPLRRIDSKLSGPVFRQVCDEPKQVIAIGIRWFFAPDFIRERDCEPGELRTRAQLLHAFVELARRKGLFRERLAEHHALLRE